MLGRQLIFVSSLSQSPAREKPTRAEYCETLAKILILRHRRAPASIDVHSVQAGRLRSWLVPLHGVVMREAIVAESLKRDRESMVLDKGARAMLETVRIVSTFSRQTPRPAVVSFFGMAYFCFLSAIARVLGGR